MKPVHLVWHRADLRLHDQPALQGARQEAKQSGGIVLPVVIIDQNIFARTDLTARRKAWFLGNARALREGYRETGSDLLVREGEPAEVFRELLGELEKHGLGAASLHLGRNFTPYAAKRDAQVRKVLEGAGVAVVPCPGQYIHEPGEVLTDMGGRYGVYSPFRRKWDSMKPPEPFGKPRQLSGVPEKMKRGEIPVMNSDIELPPAGEEAALRQLKEFIKRYEEDYEKARNLPGQEHSCSRLSMYFTIGVLSPRLAAFHAGTQKWRAELAWRDFLADILERCPEGAEEEYDLKWRGFPWRDTETEFETWKRGETGYPWVDAGMRELRATGFMHNRVRMACASFLTKHLLIDWRLGEEYFRSQLLDADRAQNVGNWQWCAGCGVDPAPYFRIFNPVSQGEKFDPTGEYVRRWVPELAGVPDRFVHCPWQAGLLKTDYPEPVVELGFGRDRFLETAKAFLGKRSP